MPHPNLLDRQKELVDYLTSVNAIFGVSGDAGGPEVPAGFDPGRLRLEAAFSHEKRMEKISTVFRYTWERLGPDRDLLVREFVRAYPPLNTFRLANAEQFRDFLDMRWRTNPPEQKYLLDLMAYEMAIARAAARSGDYAMGYPAAKPGSVRRHPGVELVRLDHDITPLFVEGRPEQAPEQRTFCLAISFSVDVFDPRIFEIPESLYEILTKLDDWVLIDDLCSEKIDVSTMFEVLDADGLVELVP